MPDEPTLGELSRRIDEQGKRTDAGLRDINLRLSDMPTEKTLLAYLAARDAEMKAIREDITEIKNDARESRTRADTAKRWAISTAFAGAALLLGVLTFVINAVQGGAT